MPLLVLVIALAIELKVNGYLIAFGVCVYGLIAALVFYHISTTHHRQTNILSDLLDTLIEGDYTFRGRDLYSEHFQSLLTRVNQLAETLQTQTVSLRENQLLLQQVIDHMDAAVLALDEQGRVIFSNRGADMLFDVQRPLSDALLKALNKQDDGKSLQLQPAWCADMHPGGEFLLRRDSFIGQGKNNTLVVLTEVGQLLHHNESAAWQRLVRVISHEINNSMAPVNTISKTMLRQSQQHALPDNHIQGLKVIQERCEHMIGFIASYSRITQLPEPERQLTDLSELLGSCASLFAGRKVVIECEQGIALYCDPGQFKQVLINLLKNADEAMKGSDEMIAIEVKSTDTQLQILIVDSGSGISNSDNLFVPFYTTKAGGSGIGLMFSQRVIANHHGRLTLNNRLDDKGAVATIFMPT